ncbi:hypothetical protein MAPG_08534 [Magnaporthiopsis poae ATCC 64411]|uniref:EamA domain-containing protein n=1 Tax=Magnaporthiopsis poae (strain ATCC 64411 / 73-15) TaxID=644358 RepID=A0A0C4E7L9_MAGP6|nr:hypothetical protein MAPG_08534 [Magnaporthiopsis poae ATCC 64411]
MSLNQPARPKAESIPLGNDGSSSTDGGSSHAAPPFQPPRPSPLKAQTLSTWTKHRAAILMLAATLCGITMNTCARFLEHGGGSDGEDPSRRPMHPMQMLLVRMAVTVFFSSVYMRWRPSPQFPWGGRELRGLLLLRGVCGFFGIWGMWQSLMYLPLAEATVITFLAPSFTGYVCHVLIHEPFTRPEQIASFVALAGVVIIARPTSLLGLSGGGGGEPVGGSQHGGEGDGVTPAQRLGAVGIALIGVLGTAGAYTTIRKMGARVNPLVPTYYFAWICTIVSLAALVFGPILDIGQPELQFQMPHGAWECLLLLVICVAGFLTQFLLTAALGGVKGGSAASQAATRNRATSMSYTAMVFAAVSDKLVFGIDMDAATFVGSVLIIGSAMWAAFSKKEEAAPTAERPREDGDLESGAGGAAAPAGGNGEDARLLLDREGSSDEESSDEEEGTGKVAR